MRFQWKRSSDVISRLFSLLPSLYDKLHPWWNLHHFLCILFELNWYTFIRQGGFFPIRLQMTLPVITRLLNNSPEGLRCCNRMGFFLRHCWQHGRGGVSTRKARWPSGSRCKPQRWYWGRCCGLGPLGRDFKLLSLLTAFLLHKDSLAALVGTPCNCLISQSHCNNSYFKIKPIRIGKRSNLSES